MNNYSQSNMTHKKIINIVIILIGLIAISLSVYFYYKINNYKNNEQQKKIDSLLSDVSKLYLFPDGEIPTVATVSDPELLKGKSFSSTALVGDKVFIFINTGKAILYRPSINKIIDVSSVSNIR